MLPLGESLGNPVALAESLQCAKGAEPLAISGAAAYRCWRVKAGCRRERTRGVLEEVRATAAAAARRHAGALPMTRRQHGTLDP